MKYTVKIKDTEVKVYYVEVEAESLDEAWDIAHEQHSMFHDEGEGYYRTSIEDVEES